MVDSHSNKYIFSSPVLCLPLLLAVPMQSHALRGDYTVGIETEYSDNIGLVETNEQNDTGLSVFAGFMLEEQTANYDAEIRTIFERVTYLDDSFDDENLGSLRGNVEWRPLPGQLHWQAEDYFTQVRRDATDPSTPNNRVNTNSFSTGPDFFVRVDAATHLQFQARYSDYYFEDSTADSERMMGSAAWIRAIRPSFDLSGNLVYEDADFTESSVSNFKRTDLFVRADAQQGRSNFIIDIGGTKIDRDSLQDVDGFLGRVTYLRQIGTTTQFELEASTQYTDSGIDLLTAGGSAFDFDRENEQISGDVFYNQSIEARYSSGPSERNWSVRGLLRDEDYETLALDRETQGLRADMHRNLSGPWYMNAYAAYLREDFTDTLEENKDKELGIGIERQLGRRFNARLDYIFGTRDSNLVGGDYDENRVVFLLYYGGDPQGFR